RLNGIVPEPVANVALLNVIPPVGGNHWRRIVVPQVEWRQGPRRVIDLVDDAPARVVIDVDAEPARMQPPPTRLVDLDAQRVGNWQREQAPAARAPRDLVLPPRRVVDHLGLNAELAAIDARRAALREPVVATPTPERAPVVDDDAEESE